ncbi:MAG: DMT family transporter [Pseudomonadota bacterium]
MATSIAPPQEPNRADWAGWVIVAFIGGSGPAAINFALEGSTPAVISGMRMFVAAIMLSAYTVATGRELLPPWHPAARKAWIYGAAAGFFGYAMPFTLFPLAQTQVSSIMAGIVMAFLPVMSIIMAALFAGEPLTKRTLFGVVTGTLGVLILIGPAIFSGADATVVGIVLLLCAVFGYAAMGVIMRRAPDYPARSFAATMMISASLMTMPFMLMSGFDGVTTQGWLSMLYLGILPTGLTSIAIITVVRRAGAAFLSTAAYASPVISVILGLLFFAEPLLLNQIIGLLTIFAGVAMSQGKVGQLHKAIWPRIVVTAFPNRKTRSPATSQTTSPPRADA